MRRNRTRPRIAPSSAEKTGVRERRKSSSPFAALFERDREVAEEAPQRRSGGKAKKRRRKGTKKGSKPARRYRVTVYPNRFEVDKPTPLDVTWRELVRLCIDEDEREVIEPDEKDNLRLWHGARIKEGGGRRNTDVESVSAAFLDLDKGGLVKAIAELERREVRAIAFSSPSGKKGRGRIIIPLRRDVTPDEYRIIWTILNSWLGGVVDKQTRSPSHGFYVPAIVEDKEFWSIEVEGKTLDVDELDLSVDKEVAPVMRAPRADELEDLDLGWRLSQVKQHIQELASKGAVEAGDRHGTLYRLAQKCLDFALPEDKMEELVIGFNEDHCDPPKKPKEVEAVLANPAKYRRHPVGCEVTVCVRIEPDHSVVLKRIVSILAERCENLYVQGGAQLIELMIDEKGKESLAPVTADRICTLVTQHVRLYKFEPAKIDKKHPENSTPARWVRRTDLKGSDWIPKELMALPAYPGIRELEGVASAATLRGDGSVLCEPGYDEATRLYFTGEELEFSHKPTREEGLQALKRVQRIFRQFPINKIARAAHMGMLLSAVARPFIAGPCPVLLIDANQKQSGKSLLAQAICIVMTGRRGKRVTWAQKDEVMLDKLHARMCTDPRIVFFDNVRNGITLKSETLDGAMTTMNITRRALYKQIDIEMPFRPLVIITGNGFSVGGDMGPRSLYIRVETPLEKPEERDDLEIENLADYLIENRSQIIKDLITVWRAWIAAGEPGEVSPKWHTVTGWEKVRKLLVWYGRKDPKLASKHKEDDEEATIKRLLVKLIHEKWPPTKGRNGKMKPGGASVGRVLSVIEPRAVGGAKIERNEEYEQLHYGLMNLVGKDEKMNSSSVGKAIKGFHKTVVGQWRLWRVNRHGSHYWTVRHVDEE